MPLNNEATDTDLKIIEELYNIGWKRGTTLFYQQEFNLLQEHKKLFPDKKSIKPDITLTDINGNVLAVFENKLDDEKKALTKLRTLYATVTKAKFLYACSPERTLFYDADWKGLESGEFRRVDSFMSLDEMLLKIEHEKNLNQNQKIIIDETIAGGINPSHNKKCYYQLECIETLFDRFKSGKQKMLVHMATGLGKTRTMVAFVKALLEYKFTNKVLFVVDRIMLADQARDDGFSLLGSAFNSVRITSSNYKLYKHANVHVVVVDTLENIYKNIPNTFYGLIIVDECHRSLNINRKLIFDHFLCPRIGLTATPRTAIAKEGKDIPEEDLAILDTYKLFGCEVGTPDYQFDLERGINEGFLAPYNVLSIETELVKKAREEGITFDHYKDIKTEEKVVLPNEKNLKIEQLNKKFIAWDNCLRIAEELKKQTHYGEKVILFGASQAHCQQLVKAINRVFAEKDDELSPLYSEAIISENNELNKTLKTWFKKPDQKPYIVTSVDIMSTGVDIPCVRFIVFANLTKSVGKYIQMLGRGTRLDPKTGKNSFKVLDFVGLCERMGDNGKGSPKPNIKVVTGGEKDSGGNGSPPIPKTSAALIDNPDPAYLIERVDIHDGKIKVVDNIPIDKARKLFEDEAKNTNEPEIVSIKKKVEKDQNYEPKEGEIETIKKWASKPQVFLDEGQLQKIYDFQQGSIWEFFLHALHLKKIPTPKERIESGFDSYIKTYNFDDKQIHILKGIKGAISANISQNKKINPQDIFNNSIYVKLIGKDYQQANEVFDNKLPEVFEDLQKTFKV